MSDRYQFPTRRDEKERRSKWILWLSVLAVIGLGAFATWAIILAAEWNPVLDEDLCPVDRAPSEDVVIVIDRTDAWNPTQRLVVEQEFREIQEAVPRFAKVHIYSVAEFSESEPGALLSLCNPGRPSDFDEFPLVGEMGARVVANPSDLAERWQREYQAALDAVFEGEIEAETRPASPIMETVRTAAISIFRGDAVANEKTLILFSDLLQNSDTYSTYTDSDWTPTDGSRLSDPSELGSSALTGVEVRVFLLDRDVVGEVPGHERSDLIELWDAYFTGQNAALVQVRRVEG